MTKLIHRTGDIFNSHARGIGHGVNTTGVMGHGIAVLFREKFGEMHSQYVGLCRTAQLDPGSVFIWEAKPGYFVYNIASQDLPGRNARYLWLQAGVDAALKHADSVNLGALALPRIGSGIGGLDQDTVETLLIRAAADHKTDIELWTLPAK